MKNFWVLAKSLFLLGNNLFPFILEFLKFLSGKTIIGLFLFLRDAFQYRKKARDDFNISLIDFHPSLTDRFASAGKTPRHYFIQDIWGATKVYQSRVAVHYDIGSRLDGFIAHCLPFCKVVMFDVRKLGTIITNLEFQLADFTQKTDIKDGSILSLSSFHAIEHFGLGRYGDPIQPFGYLGAIKEIERIIAPLGNIYISVPVGRRRLVYNAHRIFAPRDLIDYFQNCELLEFSVIDDDGLLHQNTNPDNFDHLDYGCGLYHFAKRQIG